MCRRRFDLSGTARSEANSAMGESAVTPVAASTSPERSAPAGPNRTASSPRAPSRSASSRSSVPHGPTGGGDPRFRRSMFGMRRVGEDVGDLLVAGDATGVLERCAPLARHQLRERLVGPARHRGRSGRCGAASCRPSRRRTTAVRRAAWPRRWSCPLHPRRPRSRPQPATRHRPTPEAAARCAGCRCSSPTDRRQRNGAGASRTS